MSLSAQKQPQSPVRTFMAVRDTNRETPVRTVMARHHPWNISLSVSLSSLPPCLRACLPAGHRAGRDHRSFRPQAATDTRGHPHIAAHQHRVSPMLLVFFLDRRRESRSFTVAMCLSPTGCPGWHGIQITNKTLGHTPKKASPTAEEQRNTYGHNMTTELPPPPTAASGTPSKRVPGALPHLQYGNMYKSIGIQQHQFNTKIEPTPTEDRPATSEQSNQSAYPLLGTSLDNCVSLCVCCSWLWWLVG